ncbi:MAG: FAD binding domain-containing protein [Candidatus Hadarchaeales archaeon]
MEFFRPKNPAAAIRLLRKPGSIPLAGGTAFTGVPSAKRLVDLTALKLAYVKENAKTIRVGATTTIAQLEKSPVAKSFCGGILYQACDELADTPLKNMITVGGNLACRHLWAHLPPVLMVLDGEVSLLGKKRAISVEEFLRKRPRRGDAIAEVRIPKEKNSGGGAFLKFSRTKNDYARAIATASASMENGRIKSLRVAVSGALPPTRLRELEEALIGQEPSSDAIKIAVDSTVQKLEISRSIFFSEEYLREILGVLTRRAIAKAVGLNGGNV